MSSDGDTLPEPATESLDSSHAVLQMQQQFQAMMEMMQSNEARNTERHDTLQAENMVLRDEMAANMSSMQTPKKGVFLGRLTGKSAPPTLTRRTSKYYGNINSTQTPKVLSSGDAFSKMQKYGGKAHESIHEHFITFEYHARNQDECFWCDLLQLTFTKTITTALHVRGLTLRAGRNDSRDCPQGWYDYEEMKSWLITKYHRDQFQMELLTRIFFSYEQTGTLDAYITLIDTKVATCETKFSDSLLKVLVLQKMDPATRSIMATKPATYTQTYSQFCLRALLEYDSLQSQKKKPTSQAVQQKQVGYIGGAGKKAAVYSRRELAGFELLDRHTLN